MSKGAGAAGKVRVKYMHIKVLKGDITKLGCDCKRCK